METFLLEHKNDKGWYLNSNYGRTGNVFTARRFLSKVSAENERLRCEEFGLVLKVVKVTVIVEDV